MYHIITDSDGKSVKCKPFRSVNSSDITTTTNVAIKAAVTGKRHFVREILVVNKTPAEITQVVIQSNTTVKATLPGSAGVTTSGTHPQAPKYEFDPPLEFASGEAINGKTVDATTGDFLVHIGGWVEA